MMSEAVNRRGLGERISAVLQGVHNNYDIDIFVKLIAAVAKLANVDMNRPGSSATLAIIVTVVVSFVSAWVLAAATVVVWHAFGGSFLLTAVGTGAVLWAGFTAARFITHDAFEGRPTSLTVLNIAHELVTVLVMALIIGVWPPAGTI